MQPPETGNRQSSRIGAFLLQCQCLLVIALQLVKPGLELEKARLGKAQFTYALLLRGAAGQYKLDLQRRLLGPELPSIAGRGGCWDGGNSFTAHLRHRGLVSRDDRATAGQGFQNRPTETLRMGREEKCCRPVVKSYNKLIACPLQYMEKGRQMRARFKPVLHRCVGRSNKHKMLWDSQQVQLLPDGQYPQPIFVPVTANVYKKRVRSDPRQCLAHHSSCMSRVKNSKTRRQREMEDSRKQRWVVQVALQSHLGSSGD